MKIILIFTLSLIITGVIFYFVNKSADKYLKLYLEGRKKVEGYYISNGLFWCLFERELIPSGTDNYQDISSSIEFILKKQGRNIIEQNKISFIKKGLSWCVCELIATDKKHKNYNDLMFVVDGFKSHDRLGGL